MYASLDYRTVVNFQTCGHVGDNMLTVRRSIAKEKKEGKNKKWDKLRTLFILNLVTELRIVGFKDTILYSSVIMSMISCSDLLSIILSGHRVLIGGLMKWGGVVILSRILEGSSLARVVGAVLGARGGRNICDGVIIMGDVRFKNCRTQILFEKSH